MTAVLTEVSDSVLAVAGALQIESVRETFADGTQWIEQTSASDLQVDLAEVTDVDSSALALLLEWLRECNVRQKAISYTNMPSKMRDIARVSGLDTVINIDL